MPAYSTWADNAQTIVMTTVEGAWTWEDYAAAHDAALELIQSVGHTVHLIADLSASTSPPPGAIISKLAMTIGKQQVPPHVGHIFVVGAADMGRQDSVMFSEVVAKIKLVDTLEEAYERIESG